MLTPFENTFQGILRMGNLLFKWEVPGWSYDSVSGSFSQNSTAGLYDFYVLRERVRFFNTLTLSML